MQSNLSEMKRWNMRASCVIPRNCIVHSYVIQYGTTSREGPFPSHIIVQNFLHPYMTWKWRSADFSAPLHKLESSMENSSSRIPIHWSSFCFFFTNKRFKVQTTIKIYLLLWYWNSSEVHYFGIWQIFGGFFNTSISGNHKYLPTVILLNHLSSTNMSTAQVESFVDLAVRTSFNLSQQYIKRLTVCFRSSFGLTFTRTRRHLTELNNFIAESLQPVLRWPFNQISTPRTVTW